VINEANGQHLRHDCASELFTSRGVLSREGSFEASRSLTLSAQQTPYFLSVANQNQLPGGPLNGFGLPVRRRRGLSGGGGGPGGAVGGIDPGC
jgi:hypothetical protein